MKTATIATTKAAKLFTTGRSKAVRLPQEWIGDATEVELERKGDTIIIHPRKADLWQIAQACAAFGGQRVNRLPRPKPD